VKVFAALVEVRDCVIEFEGGSPRRMNAFVTVFVGGETPSDAGTAAVREVTERLQRIALNHE
jgi:hypothetical protein